MLDVIVADPPLLVADSPVLLEPPVVLNAEPDECRSGGAEGSDSLWGDMALKYGHRVTHYSFAGHKIRATRGDIVTLSDAQLALADTHCHAANVLLQRSYPPSSRYVRNLLRRSWYQVEGATSLYAISSFEGEQVAGGTAWAVAMFLIKHDLHACPAYLFDQTACHWFAWRGVWVSIYQPPRPCGVYAAIGRRKLNLNGRLAIKTAFEG